MARVSIREYARMRGCSHTAVQKAIRSKRLSAAVIRSDSGVFVLDSDIADAEWPKGEKETMRAEYPSPDQRYVPPPRQAPPPSDSPTVVDRVASTYQQSRAAREAFAAKLAKLDFEERSGKLTETVLVRAEAFALARQVRDSLLNIPDRISAELAAETDAFKVARRLTEEIRIALESLSSPDPEGST